MWIKMEKESKNAGESLRDTDRQMKRRIQINKQEGREAGRQQHLHSSSQQKSYTVKRLTAIFPTPGVSSAQTQYEALEIPSGVKRSFILQWCPDLPVWITLSAGVKRYLRLSLCFPLHRSLTSYLSFPFFSPSLRFDVWALWAITAELVFPSWLCLMGFLGGGLNGVVVGVQSVNCVNWKLNVDIVAAVVFTLPTKSGQNQKASIASSIKFNRTSLNFYLPSWCNSKPHTQNKNTWKYKQSKTNFTY